MAMTIEPHPFSEFDLGRAQEIGSTVLGVLRIQADNDALGSTGQAAASQLALKGVGLTALMVAWLEQNQRAGGA